MTESPQPKGWLRREAVWLLEILGLSGFAVAQPVLDVFGRSPETFVFRGAGPADVILFALVVTLVPPLGLWLLALAATPLGPRVRRLAQVVILGGLAALLAIQVLKRGTPLIGLPLLGAGVAGGALAALLFARVGMARQWLRYAAVAPAIFVGVFLLASPSSKLLRPPELSRAAGAVQVEDTPVVLVVLDELPLLTLLTEDGTIDRRLYPNIAELSRRATWYRNYTTTEPSTKFAVPTILTGRLATDRTKEPLAVDYPQNLLTLFRDSHQLAVFEHVTDLCPRDVCSGGVPDVQPGSPVEAGPDRSEQGDAPSRSDGDGGVARLVVDAAGIWRDMSLPWEVTRDVTGQFGQDDVDQQPTGTGDEGDGEAQRGEVIEFPTHSKARPALLLARSIGRFSGAPGLHFAHVMLPHSPWRVYPSGVRYGDKLPGPDERPRTTGDRGLRRDEQWLVELTRQRHILQTRYVDRLIGGLVRRLEGTGTYDETLLIVTADHGLSLHRGREQRNVERHNLHEILWTPLLVKHPGQESGGLSDANVMAIDVLPTIADILGIEVPWKVDGRPATAGAPRAEEAKLVTGYHFLDGPGLSQRLRSISPRQVQAARERLREEVFRPADPSRPVRWWPYLVGPGAHLIGRPASVLPRGPDSGRSATLTQPDPADFEDVDVEDRIPGFVLGTLEGVAGATDARVAAVLNGRIASVSEVYSQRDEHGRFAFLLPDLLFRPGANELELFLLEGGVLRPLALA